MLLWLTPGNMLIIWYKIKAIVYVKFRDVAIIALKLITCSWYHGEHWYHGENKAIISSRFLEVCNGTTKGQTKLRTLTMATWASLGCRGPTQAFSFTLKTPWDIIKKIDIDHGEIRRKRDTSEHLDSKYCTKDS